MVLCVSPGKACVGGWKGRYAGEKGKSKREVLCGPVVRSLSLCLSCATRCTELRQLPEYLGVQKKVGGGVIFNNRSTIVQKPVGCLNNQQKKEEKKNHTYTLIIYIFFTTPMSNKIPLDLEMSPPTPHHLLDLPFGNVANVFWGVAVEPS